MKHTSIHFMAFAIIIVIALLPCILLNIERSVEQDQIIPDANIHELRIKTVERDADGIVRKLYTEDDKIIEVIYAGEKRNDRTDKDRVGDAN